MKNLEEMIKYFNAPYFEISQSTLSLLLELKQRREQSINAEHIGEANGMMLTMGMVEFLATRVGNLKCDYCWKQGGCDILEDPICAISERWLTEQEARLKGEG